MSVFFRRQSPPPAGGGERRSLASLGAWSSAPPTYAEINTSAAETSLQSVAVRSAVDLIASLASELPVDVYSGVGPGRQKRPTPGYLLDPAGDGHGLADWCYQALVSWLLRGNLYGDVLDVSPSGYPTQTLLYHPDEVSGALDRDGVVRWSVAGKQVDPARFLHRRVNPVPGRVQGLSPVAFHATQIGLTLTAGAFGLQWFRDGAHPSGMLVNDEVPIDGEQARTIKSRFMAALRGLREPVVLGKGWRYQQLQVSADESQFLATQGYTEAQCARIFGPGIAEVLGYDSGGSMTYSNVESRSSHLLVYSLNKWLRRLERLLTEMLPGPQYVRINRAGLLQSTTLERYRAHESALKADWAVINEVRELEDKPPVPWGDAPYSRPGAAVSGQDDQPAEPTGAEAPPKGKS